ncbi:MAG: hypothetical protein Tsb0015_05780 [Simkaniaceae bacterium]
MKLAILTKNPLAKDFQNILPKDVEVQSFAVWKEAKDFLSGEQENILVLHKAYDFEEKISEIRNSFPGKILAFVENLTAQKYQQIKEDWQLNLVADISFAKESWPEIWQALTAEEQQIEPMLKKLKATYDPTIPGRIQDFENLIAQVENTREKKAVDDLKALSHKTAGNAGTYGYMGVSKLCRDLEKRLLQILESFEPAKIDESLVKDLREFFQKLILQYQLPKSAPKKEAQPSPRQPPPEKVLKPSLKETLDLYVVDDDPSILQIMKSEAERQGLSIEVQTEFSLAEEKLQEAHFYPKILLIDQKLGEKSGFDLIKIFKKSHEELQNTIIAVISAYHEMPSRIQAAELGVDHFFSKPIEIESFFQEIRMLLFQSEIQHRVMLVEDDVDFCEFVKNSLEPLPIELKILQEGKEVLKEISTFHPILLILDLNLPDVSGMELLRCIRNDPSFKHLMIIPLTVTGEEKTIAEAYAIGIEDYLIKPIDPKMLQVRIKNALRKAKSQRQYFARDLYTGLPAFDALREYFVHMHTVYHFLSLIYLLCKEDHAMLSDENLHRFALFLEGHFEKQNIIGAIEKGEFLILMPKMLPKHAKELLEDLYKKIKQREEFSKLTIHAGIDVCVQKEEVNLDMLLRKFRENISVEQLPDFTLQTTLLKEDISVESLLKGSRILLLDDDEDLVKILAYAFQQRDMEIIIFHEGRPAMQWMEENPMPDLVLLDLMLPDIHGFDVLKFIRKKFGSILPVMILSELAKESDIVEGIKKGANDYVTKPLSLNILLEKIQNLLTE